MKKYILLLLFILISCDGKNILTNNRKEECHFGIYFLKDTTLKIQDIKDTSISDLELQNEPWISENDINFYDWSSHCIFLKKSKKNYFPSLIKDLHLPHYINGRPYIVTANDKPIYKGYIKSIISGSISPFPQISEREISYYPDDILTSDWPFLFREDIRNNDLLKNALIESNIFHSGIDVKIDTSYGIKLVENSDTSTIEYQIIIENNDIDDLYIFDPNKAGILIFNAFNRGPTFKNVENNLLYTPKFQSSHVPNSSEYELTEWYTFLKSGDSIKRKLKIGGYPHFPEGKYIFQGSYGVPKLNINKKKRNRDNGRIWIGDIRTKVWGVEFDNKKYNSKEQIMSR